MTCIIGWAIDGEVYMGSDSMGTNGNSEKAVVNRKVFRVGEFMFGVSGDLRSNQLIKHHMTIRPQQAEELTEHYLVVEVAGAIRDVFKTMGYSWVNSNAEYFSTGRIIMGYRGHLYEISTDYGIVESADGIITIGSGKEFAYGALKALMNFHPPEEAIIKALEIAGDVCSGVGGPYYVEVLK